MTFRNRKAEVKTMGQWDSTQADESGGFNSYSEEIPIAKATIFDRLDKLTKEQMRCALVFMFGRTEETNDALDYVESHVHSDE
jgi:hypothetical protein